MRKIFIDGGANNGNSIQLFLDKFPNSEEFEIHSFECNPKLVHILQKKYSKKSTIYPFAIYNIDSEKDFYTAEDVSSTLRADKISGGVDKNKFIKVKTLDLSKFIFDNFNKEDYIILKLDIEGAEYDVLPHLIETKAIEYIDELYGEYHHLKLKDITKEEHDKLISDLESLGLKMKNWCAIENIIEF